MTAAESTGGHLPTDVEHRIVVPADVSIASLLGPVDSVLRALEAGFPTVDVRVRENEIVLRGPVADVALAARLVDELVEMAQSGAPLTADVVSRSIAMLTTASAPRPAEVFSFDILSSRGKSTCCSSSRPARSTRTRRPGSPSGSSPPVRGARPSWSRRARSCSTTSTRSSSCTRTR